MSIIPTRVQEHVSRVDRSRSRWIGISAGATALWSLYRVFWLFYAAATLSSVGYSGLAGLPADPVGRHRRRRGGRVRDLLLRYKTNPESQHP